MITLKEELLARLSTEIRVASNRREVHQFILGNVYGSGLSLSFKIPVMPPSRDTQLLYSDPNLVNPVYLRYTVQVFGLVSLQSFPPTELRLSNMLMFVDLPIMVKQIVEAIEPWFVSIVALAMFTDG